MRAWQSSLGGCAIKVYQCVPYLAMDITYGVVRLLSSRKNDSTVVKRMIHLLTLMHGCVRDENQTNAIRNVPSAVQLDRDSYFTWCFVVVKSYAFTRNEPIGPNFNLIARCKVEGFPNYPPKVFQH